MTPGPSACSGRPEPVEGRALAAPAGFWIRAGAASVDAASSVGATLVLASTVGFFFARRAVVTFRIGEPDTFWKGPLPLMLGVIGEVVYLLPLMFYLVWLIEPLTGATLGKRLVGLRIGRVDGLPAQPRSLWLRHALQTASFWGWTLALLAGRWEIGALASVAGVAVFAGMCLAIGPAKAALHDRISETRVWRHDTRGWLHRHVTATGEHGERRPRTPHRNGAAGIAPQAG